MSKRVVTIKMEELEKLRIDYIDKKRNDTNLLFQKTHFLHFMIDVLDLVPKDLIHHYRMGSLNNPDVRGFPTGFPVLEVCVCVLPDFKPAIRWTINGDDSKPIPDITYFDMINSLNRSLKVKETEIQVV